MLSDGEEGQFWTFYRKTSEAVYRKAYRMCHGHHADAEDAHQRTYVKALEHWTTVSGLTDQQRNAWLATTLAREVLQIWRAPYRSHESASHDDTERRPSTGTSAGEGEGDSAAERYHRACRGIAQLNGRQREVVALHCLAGYEIPEIAEMLEINSATVRVHLFAGRRRLLEIMKREEGSADGQV
jgi:RNA polymerase sigma factor (sigma-70 family)